MRLRLPLLLMAIVSLTSCEQAKEAARQALASMTQNIKEKGDGKEGEEVVADGALKYLVDRNESGVVFRKDLPFPDQIRVSTRLERKISGRFFHASELGSKVQQVKGSELVESAIERRGSLLRYTLKTSSFSGPSSEKKEAVSKVQNPFRRVPRSIDKLSFRKTSNGWKCDGDTDFRAMAISKQLSPVFSDLLVEYALEPRPLWFAKRRIQIGDELDVTGDAIAMLVAGDATGNLRIRLEKISTVGGHPCGEFSVTGSYTRKQFPDFEGQFTNEEVSVESGRMWLSLLYPIILKQELQTIQTFRPGDDDGGLVGRAQGIVEIKVTREWGILEPGDT